MLETVVNGDVKQFAKLSVVLQRVCGDRRMTKSTRTPCFEQRHGSDRVCGKMTAAHRPRNQTGEVVGGAS